MLELLDRGGNAIYVTEVDSGRFVYVNDRACETTGYDRDELIGAHISKIETNFNERINWEDFVSEVRDNPRFTIQGEHKHKDGSTFPVEVDVDLIELNGDEYVLTVILPLDEQDQAEDEIVEAYSHYFSLFKHSPIALWNFDLSHVLNQLQANHEEANGTLAENPPPDDVIKDALLSKARIVDVNDRTLELLEAEDKSDLLENLDTIMSPSFKDELVEVFKNILRDQYKQENEMSPRTADGRPLTVLANYTVAPDGRDDLSRVFVSLVNLTPRRRAQEKAEEHRRKLREREKQLRQMAENIDEVFYNYAPDYSTISYVSPAYEEIWERNAEDLYNNPWEFAEAIHEKDRDRVLEKKEQFLEDDPRDSLVTEYRILTPGGDTKWIRDEMYPVREAGELVSIVGSAKDITEKKRVKQNLEESLEEKETLLGEIHHRVKNNMQVVTSLLKTQARKVDSEELRKEFQDTIRRVKAMALVHEKLYRSDRLTDFDLESYLTSLSEHLIRFHETSLDPATDVDLRIESVDLNLDKAITCGLIVNELVTNSLEHGLKDTENAELKISLKQNRNDGYQLVVEDNGPGLENVELRDQEATGGFDILEALVDYDLDGDFSILSKDGLRAEVNFEL